MLNQMIYFLYLPKLSYNSSQISFNLDTKVDNKWEINHTNDGNHQPLAKNRFYQQKREEIEIERNNKQDVEGGIH